MPSYLLTLEFSEDETPFLLDITNLLYDIELAYDFCVLLTEEQYREYKFGQSFWYRKGRPLRNEHRLRIRRLTKQSPLLIEVIIPSSLTSVWALLQIIEKVRNWNLSHEKLRLEVEKLRREHEKDREETRDLYAKQISQLAEERNATVIEERLAKRLSDSPLKLIRLEVKRTDSSDDTE
jgi:hypothetical protein